METATMRVIQNLGRHFSCSYFLLLPVLFFIRIQMIAVEFMQKNFTFLAARRFLFTIYIMLYRTSPNMKAQMKNQISRCGADQVIACWLLLELIVSFSVFFQYMVSLLLQYVCICIHDQYVAIQSILYMAFTQLHYYPTLMLTAWQTQKIEIHNFNYCTTFVIFGSIKL